MENGHKMTVVCMIFCGKLLYSLPYMYLMIFRLKEFSCSTVEVGHQNFDNSIDK